MKNTEAVEVKKRKLKEELAKPKKEQNKFKIKRLRESINRNKKMQSRQKFQTKFRRRDKLFIEDGET